MKRFVLITALVVGACFGSAPAHATDIQEVTSHSGIKAWLVEDHKLPLIAMSFAFRGGVEQDPADKQGLATLSMDLLTEGAGPYDAATFQNKLADKSISMGFSASRDALEGNLKTLSEDRREAFDLLATALTKPRLDTKDIERLRAQQMVAIRSQFANPDWQARYALFQKIFANHPYGQRRLGTTQTLSSLTRSDIKDFLNGHLAQDNLIIAVAGDIKASELSAALDQIFGQLPRHASLASVDELSWPSDNGSTLVPREGTQTELLFAMPGPKVDSPDYYAAEIANYTLGGGGFSSRLMQDVRDKKGLTYGIETSLSPMDRGGVIVGEAATDNPKTKEAWSIAEATMHKFYDEGPTDKEIGAAKDYITGSLPLALTSTDRIAGTLVSLQLEHRGIDYLNKRNDLVRAVTADEVRDAIHRWFNPDKIALCMVGKPDNMTASETRPQVRE